MVFFTTIDVCTYSTHGETVLSIVMSNTAEILEDRSFLMPALQLFCQQLYTHTHLLIQAITSKFSKHASI